MNNQNNQLNNVVDSITMFDAPDYTEAEKRARFKKTMDGFLKATEEGLEEIKRKERKNLKPVEDEK